MSDFKLSPNFTFHELTATKHADVLERNRLEAMPYEGVLRVVCLNLLEPLREHLGRPLVIHSGFRGPTLNARVKGSAGSQHMRGEAVDWSLPGRETEAEIEDLFRSALTLLTVRAVPFGQMILEQDGRRGFDVDRWIHMSLGEPFRHPGRSRQILRMVDGTYFPYEARA